MTPLPAPGTMICTMILQKKLLDEGIRDEGTQLETFIERGWFEKMSDNELLLTDKGIDEAKRFVLEGNL